MIMTEKTREELLKNLYELQIVYDALIKIHYEITQRSLDLLAKNAILRKKNTELRAENKEQKEEIKRLMSRGIYA